MKLKDPNKTLYNTWLKFFEAYTVNDLQAPIDSIVSVIKIHENQILNGPASVSNAYKAYQEKKGTKTKAILINLLAVFLADPDNFRFYYENLSPIVQDVWRYIVTNRCVRTSTIQKNFNYTCATTSSYSSWSMRSTLNKDLCFFGLERASTAFFSSQNQEMDLFIFPISPFISLMVPLFYEPEAYLEIRSFEELPSNTPQLMTFQAESLIFTEMPILDSLIKQKYLCLNEKAKLNASDLKKAILKVGLTEFFPEKKGEASQLRAKLLLPFYASISAIQKKEIKKQEDQLRAIASILPRCNPTWALPLLLPFVSGLRLNIYKNSLCINRLHKLINQLTTARPTGWVSVEQWMLHNRYLDINYIPFAYYDLQQMDLSCKLTNVPIKVERHYTYLTIAFVNAYLFLMASLGFLELAYEEYIPKTHPTPFHTLRYIRLTNLGRYAIEITNQYEPAVLQDQTNLFDIDESNFIIRSTKKDNPYESLLQDIAEPIGYNRYRLSPVSFLRSCQTRDDVDNKIEFFKRFICQKLPPLWSDFFDSLRAHCQPLSAIPDSQYSLYQLDPENKELLRLITTDPIIKMYTLRAENYILLIQTAHLRAITDRLKSFGYLL